jgi:hypothetical protein
VREERGEEVREEKGEEREEKGEEGGKGMTSGQLAIKRR